MKAQGFTLPRSTAVTNVRVQLGGFFLIHLFLVLSFACAQISYSEIESLIQDKNIKTIEELLAELPANFKNHYTLLKKSSAVQEASLESPRAVVYGETGELTMTFNSNPDHGGYNDVEFLAFDKEKNEFELRVISFVGGEVIFSEKNPTQCTHCHGISPRPLWDNYPSWKNSYGSNSDMLTPEEENILKSEIFREHSRFKAIFKKDADPLYPFKDAPKTFGPNALLGKYYTNFQARANKTRFYDSIGYAHSERLAVLALLECKLAPETNRMLEYHYLEKIKALYPHQIATLEWWTKKYAEESFYLTLLKSIYLFGIDYFQNNYFNLKMRYHEEHLSTDSTQSVRSATLDVIASSLNDKNARQLIASGNKSRLCDKYIQEIAH